ncbi:MAG: EAL domain-containing protein [Mogibacterium sp.]|nr:EAL domain-containing protein [Mogibacterium sp.]
MDRYRFSEDQRLIMEHSPVPFAVYQFLNKRVVTIALSGGFLKMLGFTIENKEEAYRLMDENMYEGTHPDDAARVAEAALRFATEGGRYEEIYRSRNNAEGSYKIIHAIGEHYFTSTGERLATVWYMDEGEYNEDLGSEQKDTLKRIFINAMREESMIHANNYDYLTGLPSMTYFFELAEAGRLKMLRQGLNPVMLFFDLNGMKYYNSKYGFAEGDRLLISFAKLLVEFFSNENCCRVGQDHFAAYTDYAGIRETLDELFARWEDSGNANVLPVRVGIYRDDMEEVDGSLACDRAKYACDSIRNIYGSCYTFFDEEMLTAANNRRYILDNFDRALNEGWIEVWFQPIVRTTNGCICDEEALSRWNDPVYGILSPAEFIPILEDAGVIYKLDLYVVDKVIEILLDLKANPVEGINIVPQSINLSRTDFKACDMIEEITKRVDAAGLDHSLFTIEITESTVGSDFEYMKDQVERFRELGFSVWMDDFGSGYSSLELIQSVKFDVIKFDMSFMKQYDSGYGSRIILTELMKMTASLGIESLCEGVEREEQVDFLREVGCSMIQGYYYGRPQPNDAIKEKYLSGNQTTEYEDPEQSEYYETIGRINLHDLSVIADKDDSDLQQYFNGLPMAMIEVLDDKVRFVRSNQSYRDFMEGYLGLTVTGKQTEFAKIPEGPLKPFLEQALSSISSKDRVLIDSSLSDNTMVHVLVRRITENPVTNASAIVTTVLAVDHR